MNTLIPRRTTRSQAMLLFLAVVLCTPVAYSAPQGELDATFGENGRITIGPQS